MPAGHLPRPGDADRVTADSRLTVGVARELFESQLIARHLDVAAYELRARGEGFYTISSAGHEGNVVLGRLLEPTDPALLHYRSAALFVERARKRPDVDALDCVTLGLTASSEDPISGGRHKVFGSTALGVLPQTSTISSQLPKAVGLAMSLERARKLRRPARIAELAIPDDAIVITSLGDASINHASATVAINAARWVTYQKLRLPLLFVCEDNGIGLSVRTPAAWPAAVLSAGPCLPYFDADGSNLPQAFEVASRAVALCREQRCPVVLHLRCVRLMGHAGTDPDTTYRTRAELEAAAERDPVLCSARLLVEHGVLAGQALFDLDADVAQRVWHSAARAVATPKLQSAAQVTSAIAHHAPDAVRSEAARADYHEARLAAFGGEAKLPEKQPPQPSRDPDQPGAARPVGQVSARAAVRRGRGARRAASTTSPRACGRLRHRARVQHAARRDHDPRASRRATPTSACCPCPRSSTSPSCTTPRTSCAARPRARVLLARPDPIADGAAHRQLRLPARIRRALPQRQLDRRAARHPGLVIAGAEPRRRRGRTIAHAVRMRQGRWPRLRVPRADRAVHERDLLSPATARSRPRFRRPAARSAWARWACYEPEAKDLHARHLRQRRAA